MLGKEINNDIYGLIFRLKRRRSITMSNMAEELTRPSEGVVFGDSLLSSMNRKPDSCIIFSRLRKKIGLNLKPTGKFYGNQNLADLYLHSLQEIHYSLCTAYEGVDAQVTGTTTHP